jgi:hypothetical protein
MNRFPPNLHVGADDDQHTAHWDDHERGHGAEHAIRVGHDPACARTIVDRPLNRSMISPRPLGSGGAIYGPERFSSGPDRAPPAPIRAENSR